MYNVYYEQDKNTYLSCTIQKSTYNIINTYYEYYQNICKV
jgi:hypothetical protein